MYISLAIIVVFTILLLGAHFKKNHTGVWLTKPVAATGFVAMGYLAGALETTYGNYLFVAFLFSWLGDILLIPKSKKIFIAGMLSFLLAHVFFALAFVQHPLNWRWAVGMLVLVIAFVIPFGRWINPHLSKTMFVPLWLYVIAISVMMVCAAGAYGTTQSITILAGAVIFCLSDIAVARERFVTTSFYNKLVGLPLYFGAQVILVYTL